MIPMVYYFPLLWRAPKMCHENFEILNITDSSRYQIKLQNLATDYGDRILCEEDCPPENYNGFLNWADSREMCNDPTRIFYHCPCHGAARWTCAVDTHRLTEGTNGYLETFGYLRDLDSFAWLPVCVPDIYEVSALYGGLLPTQRQTLEPNGTTLLARRLAQLTAVEAIATVVCRSLGFDFFPKFGFMLPYEHNYVASATVYFPFHLHCTGYEFHLRECTMEDSDDKHCNAGVPLHFRCTDGNRDPNTVKFSTLVAINSTVTTNSSHSTNSTFSTNSTLSSNSTLIPDSVLITNPSSIPRAFEVFESNYGRWVPVSRMGWTPTENEMACHSTGRMDVFGAHRMYSCLEHHDYYTTRGINPVSGQYQMMIDGVNYPVVCDMTKTDPGWLLLFNNTFNWFWSDDDVMRLHPFNYTTYQSYSILGLADQILKRFPGNKYDIRIDVNGKGVFSDGGGIFRIPRTESLVSSVPNRPMETIQISDSFQEHPESGFTLEIPHLSNWSLGLSLYRMSDNRWGSGPYGNLITRNPDIESVNGWVPGERRDPRYTSLWIREVHHDTSLDNCSYPLYLFERRDFSRRQLYASSSLRGSEARESVLWGAGWIPGSLPAPPGQWIQVDLIGEHLISKLVIAGTTRMVVVNETAGINRTDHYYVTTFQLMYKSAWEEPFQTMKTVFKVDRADGIQRTVIKLKKPVRGRIFRIVPDVVAVNGTQRMAGLRWGLYGCGLNAHPLSTYAMTKTRSHAYRVAGRTKYGTGYAALLNEDDYLSHANCTFTSVELDLTEYVHIDGLVFAGNPYRPVRITGIKAYYSADGSREALDHHLHHVNGTVIAVQETIFAMLSENEPLYTVHPAFEPDARLLRLQFDKNCPFRFEVIGKRIEDYCEVQLNVAAGRFNVTMSSQKDRSSEFNIDKGFSAWFPKTNNLNETLTVDMFMPHSITAIGVRGVLQDWLKSFALYHALARNNWTLYREYNVTDNPIETLMIRLNPPIDQARFIRIQNLQTKDRIALRLELFGCTIPPSKSSHFPGVSILRKTSLVYDNVTIPAGQAKSRRACYNAMSAAQHGAFLYYSEYGRCREARALNDTAVLGFQRDELYDLHWPDNDANPDWGPRPLISHVECPETESHLSQCKLPHITDDPANPSAPIIPECAVSCGHPGRISCARKFGYNYYYSEVVNAPAQNVSYQCLYDYLNTRSQWINLTCQRNETWTPFAAQCPKYWSDDLTGNRPLTFSSISNIHTAMAMAWPSGNEWTTASLSCRSTRRTTYPYVTVDMIAANDVYGVTIDFGIGEELPNANLNIYVTNTLNPKYALNDLCHSQVHAKSNFRRWLNIACRHPVVGRYITVQIRESEPVNLVICSIQARGTSCGPYENLGMGGQGRVAQATKVKQSSAEESSSPAFLAIDGHHVVPDADPYRNSTCFTTTDTPGFMTIDLGSQAAVYGVTLYGAGDGKNLNITVSPILSEKSDYVFQSCWDGTNGTASNETDGRVVIPCTDGPVFGRYVTVGKINKGQGLTVCEVKVWARNCSERINRALYKPVQYSSEGESGVSPSYATDEEPRTAFATDPEGNPFLIVDMVGTYVLSHVEVVNGRYPLTNLNVSTSSTGHKWDNFSVASQVASSVKPDETVTMRLYQNASWARYVWVEIYNTSNRNVPVEIREIRAISFGCGNNPLERSTYRNLVLALPGVTAAAPLKPLADAFVTVDGMKVPRREMCYETRGVEVVLWKAVLPSNATVRRISVYGIFPLSLKAFVDETLCGSISSPDGKMREFSTICDYGMAETPIGLEGKTVVIQRMASDFISTDSLPITLCEVEVWGTT